MDEKIENSVYFEVVANIKQQIKMAQYKVALGANRELIMLYWNIGTTINEKAVWGNKFIVNLAKDIKFDFPDTAGYSVRNLKYMAKFARLFPDFEIVQRSVALIPWRHNIALIDKIDDSSQRLWYAEKAVQNGWTRDVLVHQIETDLYQRQVLAEKVNNFAAKLPLPQSELAQQTMKDPYVFDLIPFGETLKEREIERTMVQHITKLLLEFGEGFAFLGNQYHLEVGGEDFYIDLLFYNLKLRCYVVVELKTGDFKPEYIGKLNFYLSAVDNTLKTEIDCASIGLLLCKTNNKIIAEYALKDVEKPIGVSEYRFTKQLPENLEKLLPSIEKIETMNTIIDRKNA
jgi:predicted nuclease of restriction endonuclease-like (RecB) superfamily